MKQSIDLKNVSKALTRFFERYHTIVFFLFLGIGLAVCMIMIVQIINLSSQTDMSGVTPIDQTFDEATVERLQELDRSDQQPHTPSGRVNPFVE